MQWNDYHWLAPVRDEGADEVDEVCSLRSGDLNDLGTCWLGGYIHQGLAHRSGCDRLDLHPGHYSERSHLGARKGLGRELVELGCTHD